MLTLHRPVGHDKHTDNWIGPAPWITAPPPGPMASLAEALSSRATSPSGSRAYPLVVHRAQGSVVEDVDANRYLDFTAGATSCSIGHCHSRVVRAIEQQAGDFIQTCGSGFYHESMIALAEKLAQLAPGRSAKRVLFTNGGGESVEVAVELARHHARRKTIIAFRGPSHSRTTGPPALTPGQADEKWWSGPPAPMVEYVPYGDVAQIKETVFKHKAAPDEVAAILVEPLLSKAGYVVPPPEFLLDLRALCDEHGILLVADEIRTGMGRTGKMFCCEHEGVVPDILLVGDGLAGGLPLGAVIAREPIMYWPQDMPGSPQGGSLVSCAAALATIELLEKHLIANAAEMYHIAMNKLEGITAHHKCIAEPRGRGLMLAVEVVASRRPWAPDPELRDRIVTEAFTRGLLLAGCGEAGIGLTPPLCINPVQLEVGLDVFEEAVATVSA